MDQSKVSVNLEETLLNCPVCYSRYDSKTKLPRTPKILPLCGHTLCHTCLREIFKRESNTAKCPIDRIQLLNYDGFISEETIEQFFPNNMQFINILDRITTQNEISQHIKCLKHQKAQNLVCLTDKTTICEDCRKDHRAHKIMLIQDIQLYCNERRKDLEEMKNSSRQSVEEASKRLQDNKTIHVQELVEKNLVKLKSKLRELVEEEVNDQYENEQVSIRSKNLEIEQAFEKEIEKLKKPAHDHDLIEAFENPKIIEPYLFDQEQFQAFSENTVDKISQKLDKIKLSCEPKSENLPLLDDCLEFSFNSEFDLEVTSKGQKRPECDVQFNEMFEEHEKLIEHENIISANIDFTYIKLSNKFLPALQSLMAKLTQVSKIKLDLSHKDFDDNNAVELFSSKLLRLDQLKLLEINLRDCLITDLTITNGVSHAAKRMICLESLILNFEKTKISDQGLQELSEVLAVSSLKLKNFELDASKTSIGSLGLKHFRKNLEPVLKKATNLKLVFNSTKIGDIGIEEISRMFEYLKSIKSFELSVFDAAITDVGLNIFADQMQKFSKTVERISTFYLTLSSNSQIGDKSIIYLAENILPIMQGLEAFKLNLRKTSMTDEGAKGISKALGYIAKNLRELSIVYSNNKLTGFEPLSSAFAKFENLKRFEISYFGIPITSNSFSSLFKNINHSNLCRIQYLTLNLSCTKIKDDGIITLGNSVLRHLDSLEGFEISLRDTNVTDESVCELLENIKPVNLRTFVMVLSNTLIKDRSLSYIIKILNECKKLKTLELNLRFTDICDDTVCCLCESMVGIAQNLETLRFNISHTRAKERSVLKLLKLIPLMINVQDLELELSNIPIERITLILSTAIATIVQKIKILKLNLASTLTYDSDINIIIIIIIIWRKVLPYVIRI